jgi:hypothetical protein
VTSVVNGDVGQSPVARAFHVEAEDICEDNAHC